jgi:hypothetical protein
MFSSIQRCWQNRNQTTAENARLLRRVGAYSQIVTIISRRNHKENIQVYEELHDFRSGLLRLQSPTIAARLLPDTIRRHEE